MRISDWSSDVCSSDLHAGEVDDHLLEVQQYLQAALADLRLIGRVGGVPARILQHVALDDAGQEGAVVAHADHRVHDRVAIGHAAQVRSEEHTSELQSLMRISYAVFCLKKKKNRVQNQKSMVTIHPKRRKSRLI